MRFKLKHLSSTFVHLHLLGESLKSFYSSENSQKTIIFFATMDAEPHKHAANMEEQLSEGLPAHNS